MQERRILSSITIMNVTSSDAGDYKCIAENPAGRSEMTYKLWVFGAGGDSLAANEKPRLTVSQKVVVGICVGLAVVVLAITTLVLCLVSQRRRWMNAYKVTDTINNAKKVNTLKSRGDLTNSPSEGCSGCSGGSNSSSIGHCSSEAKCEIGTDAGNYCGPNDVTKPIAATAAASKTNRGPKRVKIRVNQSTGVATVDETPSYSTCPRSMHFYGGRGSFDGYQSNGHGYVEPKCPVPPQSILVNRVQATTALQAAGVIKFPNENNPRFAMKIFQRDAI